VTERVVADLERGARPWLKPSIRSSTFAQIENLPAQ